MKKDIQQPRPTKRNKVRVVSARFTDLEYQAVEKRRKDAGVSLSRFVRSVVLTGKVVQRISKADADIPVNWQGKPTTSINLPIKPIPEDLRE